MYYHGVPAGDGSSADDKCAALLSLLSFLKSRDYHFVPPTPETHRRVLARACTLQKADVLRDLFGWNRRVSPESVDPALQEIMQRCAIYDVQADGIKSRLRVASLDGDLFLHSAFPTDGGDAIFFGPDSYRFAKAIARELDCMPPAAQSRMIDMGTGAGVGAIVAARHSLCPTIIATDINPAAVAVAKVNMRFAGVAADFRECGDLSTLNGLFDLIVANPPFMMDPARRTYRDGGGMHGAAVSLDMARQAVPRLREGGRFLLYTGSAITKGEDRLKQELAYVAAGQECTLRYEEIDPDIFGEEMATDMYRDVERIALVIAIVERDRKTG